jgi:uncharacterized protein YbjT (DUF2867 family)
MYPQPCCLLSLLRWHGEIVDAIKETGIPYALIAPAHFYQNYIQFSQKSIQLENTIYLPQGDTRKSMVDAFDIAAVAYKLLTGDIEIGKIYTLAGYDYNNYEIANLFSDILKRKISYLDISPDEYVDAFEN